jgi:hypothetical protein
MLSEGFFRLNNEFFWSINMPKLVDPRETDGRLVAQFNQAEINADLGSKLDLIGNKIGNPAHVDSVLRLFDPKELAGAGESLRGWVVKMLVFEGGAYTLMGR